MTFGEKDFCCDNMVSHLRGGEVAICYLEKFRQYGIRVLDGGSSIQTINYCPWCGTMLPGSLRDAWFDMIDQLGFEPDDIRIPSEMLSDEWWRRRKM